MTARPPSTTPAVGELTGEERQALLEAAREAIAAHFARRLPRLPPKTPSLAAPRGAFVTLRRLEDDDLRGCIGQMRSDQPLLDTVARMAVAAATEDGRFDPVTAGELPELAIEISALGPLAPIRPEDVVVGRHGLLIGYGGRRGVLLPQVPIEQGWDRETFLDHTCLKAGLAPGTWSKPGVELLAFTAQVFGESDPTAA
jgi:AmmeMemoRadiSam system protein A